MRKEFFLYQKSNFFGRTIFLLFVLGYNVWTEKVTSTYVQIFVRYIHANLHEIYFHFPTFAKYIFFYYETFNIFTIFCIINILVSYANLSNYNKIILSITRDLKKSINQNVFKRQTKNLGSMVASK